MFDRLRVFLSSSVLFFITSICLSQQTDFPPLKTVDSKTLIAELQQLIPQLMDSARVPGLSIALIRDGEIVWNGSYGVRSAETNVAVNDSTLFQAASLSKCVFAYAVMKLVDAGQIDLDTPLVNYWPEDYVEVDDRDQLITARMALSHTTGFPNWRPRDGALKILFTPGEKFSYSGEGFGYLQKTVEHITGEKLNDFMRRTVFEPLEMLHSSYEWQQNFEANYAVGHDEFSQAVNRDPMTNGHAAYSLYTTAIDYAKFICGVLNGSGLSEASASQMLSPQIQLDQNCTNCTNTSDFTPSESNYWGLGFGLQKTDDGTSFWHWGDQGIYRCYTVAFQNQKSGLVYFTNSENGLSIRDDLVLAALGGDHSAFAWLHYDRFDAPIKTFARLLIEGGLDPAMSYYEDLKKTNGSAKPIFEEGSINQLGYTCMRLKKMAEAIAVFKLNVELYPNSWNVYDSLGEAYMENGEGELAIQSYNKSIELNPDNQNGREMLEKLSSK
jgi:CubicO group peptidase (beta-lactamase class C family)